MDFKMSYVGLIALVFGIVAIIAVFLDWYSFSLSLIESSGTGWEIFDNGTGDYSYFPVIVLILGILGVILGLLDFISYGSKITQAIIIIVGILVIVLAYMTYANVSDVPEFLGSVFSMGMGLYLEIVAGVGMIIAGLLGVVGVLDGE